jgi:hypothetical protein
MMCAYALLVVDFSRRIALHIQYHYDFVALLENEEANRWIVVHSMMTDRLLYLYSSFVAGVGAICGYGGFLPACLSRTHQQYKQLSSCYQLSAKINKVICQLP